MREKKQNIYRFILCILILAVSLYDLNKMMLPVILGDELGYWTGAAWIQGLDWSSVMSRSSYFGYGYGILLSPLLFISNAVLRYRVAIILNSFMLCAIYIFIDVLLNKWFPNISKVSISIVSFITVLYPSLSFYTRNTQCEIFLSLLFILIIFVISQIYDKPSLVKLLIVVGLQTLVISVHMRSIGVSVATFMFIFYFFYKKRVSKKEFLIYTFELFILGIIFILLYQNINKVEFSWVNINGELEKNISNTFVGQNSKIDFLLTLEGLKNLILTVSGRIFYLISATFMMGFYGCAVMCKKILKKEEYFEIYVYILLNLFFSIIISAIFMIFPARIDTTIHGRYFEHILIIVIAIGILNIKELHNIKLLLFIGIGIESFVALTLFSFYTEYNINTINIATITGLVHLVPTKNLWTSSNFPIVVALVSIIISAFLIFLILKSKTNKKYYFIMCILIGIVWQVLSSKNVQTQFYKGMDHIKKVSEWQEGIKEINKKEYEKIYYLYSLNDKNTNQTWDMYRLRFLYPWETIEVLSINDSIDVILDQKGLYLLHKQTTCEYDEILYNFNILWENDLVYMMIPK